jgi:hypothetical protein
MEYDYAALAARIKRFAEEAGPPVSEYEDDDKPTVTFANEYGMERCLIRTAKGYLYCDTREDRTTYDVVSRASLDEVEKTYAFMREAGLTLECGSVSEIAVCGMGPAKDAAGRTLRDELFKVLSSGK